MNRSNTEEAYLAMFLFLERQYDITKSSDLALLLGAMSITPNGLPLDNALWHDWIEAVERTKDPKRWELIEFGHGGQHT